jgi:hypothetical protein
MLMHDAMPQVADTAPATEDRESCRCELITHPWLILAVTPPLKLARDYPASDRD